MIYADDRFLTANIELNKSLVVPGLSSEFGSYDDRQVTTFLDLMTEKNLRYTQFHSNWLHKILQRTYSRTNYSQIIQNDDTIDYVRLEITNPLELLFQVTTRQRAQQINPEEPLDEEEVSDESEEEQDEESKE